MTSRLMSWPDTPPPPQQHRHITVSAPLTSYVTLCSSFSVSGYTVLSLLPSLSPLTTQSFLCSLFPSSCSFQSMRGNFHCSFYPGTGFHCGNTANNTAPVCFPHWGGGSRASCHCTFPLVNVEMISNNLAAHSGTDIRERSRFISPSISGSAPIQISAECAANIQNNCNMQSRDLYLSLCASFFIFFIFSWKTAAVIRHLSALMDTRR